MNVWIKNSKIYPSTNILNTHVDASYLRGG